MGKGKRLRNIQHSGGTKQRKRLATLRFASLDSVLALPIMAGPADDGPALEYLNGFLQFELWIRDGGPPDGATYDDLPAPHRFMLDRWPDAFEHYRHATWVLLERALGINPWSATVRSMFTRAEQRDPEGATAFIERAREGSTHFKTQRDNALRAMEAVPDNASTLERARATLHAFAALYEIDFVAWFLAVLGKALLTGKFDADAYGGPLTQTAQGSLIDHVATSLDNTPLGPLVRSAYLTDLRNAVGHNTYDITVADEAVRDVRDTRSGQSWPGEVVFDAWTGLLSAVNGVHTTLAYRDGVLEARESGRFADAGVVSVAFVVDASGTPRVTVFQLWCFHDVDPDGRWLDAAALSITRQPNGLDQVRLTAHTVTLGEPVTGTAFGDAVHDRGWVHVSRIAVTPALGLGHPAYTVPDRTAYELVGLPDEHVVPVRIDPT